MGVIEAIGWATVVLTGLAVVYCVTIVLIAFWPVRLTLVTASRRVRTTGFIPRCDWRTPGGKTNRLNALIGVSSRGKTRWFVGLILFGKDEQDPSLGVSRIVRRRASTTPASQSEGEPS